MLLISCAAFAQTKFVYNAKGGMLKASYTGTGTCLQTPAGGQAVQAVDIANEKAATQPNPAMEYNRFSIRVLPNPATTISTVECYFTASGPMTLKLINATGVTLFEKAGYQRAGTFHYTHSISSLPQGTYLWVLTMGEHTRVIQWVK